MPKILACVITTIAIIGLLAGIVLIFCGQIAIGGIVWAATTLLAAIASTRIKSVNSQER